MKKIIYSLLAFATVAITLSSCNKDIEAFPTPNDGAMVLLDQVTTPVFNVNDINNAVYAGVLRAPSANVQSIQFKATIFRTTRLFSPDSANVGGPKAISGGADVPFTLTATDLAAAVTRLEMHDADNKSLYDPNDATTFTNISAATDLMAGDRVEITAVVTDDKGQTHNISDISANLTNPGQRMAYAFTTFVSCPFDQAVSVGTYDVTTLTLATTFGETNLVRTVEAGQSATQLVIRGGMFPTNVGGTDMYINVNANTGQTTIANGPDGKLGVAFDGSLGTTFASDYGSGTAGFTFSCTGDIRLGYTLSCCGGTRTFNLKKR